MPPRKRASRRKPALKTKLEELAEVNKKLTTVIAAQNEAIGRLEMFTFSMAKYLKDEGLVTLDRMGTYMEMLTSTKTLETFWEASPPEEQPEASTDEE